MSRICLASSGVDQVGVGRPAEFAVGVVAKTDRDVPALRDDGGGEGEEVPAEIADRPFDAAVLGQEVQMRLEALQRPGMPAEERVVREAEAQIGRLLEHAHVQERRHVARESDVP